MQCQHAHHRTQLLLQPSGVRLSWLSFTKKGDTSQAHSCKATTAMPASCSSPQQWPASKQQAAIQAQVHAWRASHTVHSQEAAAGYTADNCRTDRTTAGFVQAARLPSFLAASRTHCTHSTRSHVQLVCWRSSSTYSRHTFCAAAAAMPTTSCAPDWPHPDQTAASNVSRLATVQKTCDKSMCLHVPPVRVDCSQPRHKPLLAADNTKQPQRLAEHDDVHSVCKCPASSAAQHAGSSLPSTATYKQSHWNTAAHASRLAYDNQPPSARLQEAKTAHSHNAPSRENNLQAIRS